MNRSRRFLFGVTVDRSIQFHRHLALSLKAAGQDVHFVSSDGPKLRELDGKITTHVLAMVRRPHPVKDLVSFRKWVRLLRSVRPDIVLIGTPKASLLGILAARILRVPRRIYFVHGLRYESATGLGRTVLVVIEKLVVHCSTEVIAVSESVRTGLQRDGISADRSVMVIGRGSAQGVDIDVFRPASHPAERLDVISELGLDPQVPVLGYLGRLTREKGLDELAEALTQLVNAGTELQLLVVGSIDDESGRQSFGRLRASGMHCVATGYTTQPARYLRAMDAFCLPTHREGLPNAILEAFATEVPVVSTKVTGVVDLVTDGETGVLVEPRNPTQLATALRRVLSDTTLTTAISRSARQFVTTYFSRDAVTQAQMNLLLAPARSRTTDESHR